MVHSRSISGHAQHSNDESSRRIQELDTRRRSAVRPKKPRCQNGIDRFALPTWEGSHMPKLVHSPPKYRRRRAFGQAILTISGRNR